MLLRVTPYAESEVLRLLGQGSRCRVFLVRDRPSHGAQAPIRRAHERHERRHGGALAHFEYERNASLHRSNTLPGRIAEPIGCHVDGSCSSSRRSTWRSGVFRALLPGGDGGAAAEPVRRRPRYRRGRSRRFDLRSRHPPKQPVRDDVLAIRCAASDAVRFQQDPLSLAPPNPFFGWLVRCGWIGPESVIVATCAPSNGTCSASRHGLHGTARGRRRLWWYGLPCPAGSLELEPLLFCWRCSRLPAAGPGCRLRRNPHRIRIRSGCSSMVELQLPRKLLTWVRFHHPLHCQSTEIH